MIKEALVCLESSPSSEAATRVAITIANDFKARLVGLAIIDEPDIRAGTPTGIGGASFKVERDDALVADARKSAADALALFERRCREAQIEARALEIVGRPAASILAEMATRDVTIIGRDANFRFEIESDDTATREEILHRAAEPVLIVPETVEGPLGQKVVVAYDGSRAARRAMASFAASGLAQSRSVHVATVDDSGEQAWAMATAGVKILVDLGVAATVHNIVSALSNEEALFGFANEIGAGLIVMGAFAHSRLAHLFHGSVTRGLVERTTIPLYLQH
ncbi:MAG TPA: universal stress protein [Polyangia bacterium]|jgi:nucleotide-binding universal stress UspA family protein|nr:universal stress protein [Polyangia bacterium]